MGTSKKKAKPAASRKVQPKRAAGSGADKRAAGSGTGKTPGGTSRRAAGSAIRKAADTTGGRPAPIREKLTTVKPSGGRDDSFFDLVHAVARQIPTGRVTSYGAIAAALGTRLSARMVGWAMISAHHAMPPVPAHRVVNRNGLLSGRHHYTPPERMQQLLEKEGIRIKDSVVVDFDKLFWDPTKEC